MSGDVSTTPPTSTPSGVRARLARLGGARQGASPVLDPLLRVVRATHPKADLGLIRRAYVVAEEAHRGQVRKSGDAYITHPLAVATILAELGLPPSTLAAALLHDTVEDTGYSLEALEKDFGAEIARMVDGVTKLDKVTYGDAAQAETVRKMIVAMAKDINVLVIKLADRLHNARTWRYVSPDSARRKAVETLEIYAPLAHRLGMNTIKWELEDLSFAVIYPKVHEEIVRLVSERAPAREEYLTKVRTIIDSELRKARIKSTITSRPKHYYSVYQKMVVRKHDFNDIYDLVGVRVLVDDIMDCYAVLGLLHARFTPVPGRFKDYISIPKFNLYQSLHTTVIGPDGKHVEVQIRTYAMHRRAEYGVAAHWKYKLDAPSPGNPNGTKVTSRGTDGATGPLDEMTWLRQLLDWQRETDDPGEFLENLRFEIGKGEVYAYTPAGRLIALPAEATPVDFAYAVHTEVGHRCIGARVNQRLVPLDTQLKTGDTVEIVTSKGDAGGPSRDWLNFVKSGRARNKIRHWFTKERREEAIESGREQIAKVLRKQNLPLQRLLTTETLTAVASDLRLPGIDGLYAAVGEGHTSPQHVVSQLVASMGGEDATTEDLAEATIPHATRRPTAGDPGVTVVGTDDVWVKIARCCTPVPGDEIIGFVTTGHGVSVHRADCTNAQQLTKQPERLLPVAWSPSSASVFLVQLQIEALDRSGLLSDITRVLTESKVNILSASVNTTRDRVALSKFTFEMAETTHLGSVLGAVRKVSGVLDAYRITGASRRQDEDGAGNGGGLGTTEGSVDAVDPADSAR